MPPPRRHLSVDELTQRASTGLAIRRGEIKISDPIPSSYVHNGAEMDQVHEQSTPRLVGSRFVEDGIDTASHARSVSSNLPAHASKFTERTSPAPSPVNNAPFGHSHGEALRRRNTGLRATIRRMFSSKRDRSTHSRGMSSPSSIEPGRILSMTGPQSENLPMHTRISEAMNSRALQSHAVSPHQRVESENIQRPESSTRQTEPRRNTLPNLMLVTPEETGEQYSRAHEITTTLQRPKTAINNHAPNLTIQQNRRSRSAEGFGDLSHLAEKPRRYRDRGGEIAYWRNSILADPVPTLSTSRSDTMLRTDSALDEAVSHPSVEPIQDFDFGLARTPVPSPPTTLLERVNTIEVKLYDFEYALSKLQGTEISQPELEQSAKRRGVVERVLSDANTHSNDLLGFKDADPSTNTWQRPRSKPRRSLDRNSKATTIRAPNQNTPSDRSQTPSISSARIASEQYNYLYELIREERLAREHLEAQVIHLQKEVDILKTPVYSYTQQPYPTPSPDSFHNSLSRSTPQEPHQGASREQQRDLKETSRFSMTETDSDTDIDNVQPEVYQTPQENTFHFEARRAMHTPMI